MYTIKVMWPDRREAEYEVAAEDVLNKATQYEQSGGWVMSIEPINAEEEEYRLSEKLSSGEEMTPNDYHLLSRMAVRNNW